MAFSMYILYTRIKKKKTTTLTIVHATTAPVARRCYIEGFSLTGHAVGGVMGLYIRASSIRKSLIWEFWC